MRIIDTVTGETVATIIGGNNMTTDEAIRFVGEFIEDAEPDEANVIINGREYYSDDLDTVYSIQIAYVNTNAYKMIVVDDCFRRYVMTERDFDFTAPRTEEDAERFLSVAWENIIDNYNEWDSHEESMGDLTETAEVLAVHFVQV